MSTKRKRVSRGIGANAGIIRAYTKAIQAISTDFRAFVANEILNFLENKHALTADSLIPLSSEERKKNRVLKQKLLNEFAKRNPDLLKSDLDKFISSNMALWSELLATASVNRVTIYINQMAFMTSEAQRRAFLSAKVTTGLVNKAFTVPTIKKRFISDNALKILPDLIKDNVNLITKLNIEDISRISDTIYNGLMNGENFNQLRDVLKATQGFTDKRANTVAQDQTNKITQLIQIENAKAVGVKKAVWVHIAGKYTSRASHIKMNGQEFDISKGCYDEFEKKYIFPAQLINCRCEMQMIFDDEVLNG
jgi:hypothetical protein